MARTRPSNSFSFFTPEKIFECYDINDVRQFLASNSWLLLDLDNTVIEPEDHHHEMGGDQWFVRFIDYASKVPLGENDPNHIALVLAVYHAVQPFLSLKLVQPEIVDIIKQYQDMDKGRVLAVTARGPEIIEPTLRELSKLGIDFSRAWGKNELILDVGDAQHPPVFKNGVLFCGGKAKDQCFKSLVNFLGQKPNVIMIDDKRKYLDTMQKMLQESYQGDFIGLHYRRLDEKVQKHDFDKAQRKLHELRPSLPHEAKEALGKLKL